MFMLEQPSKDYKYSFIKKQLRHLDMLTLSELKYLSKELTENKTLYSSFNRIKIREFIKKNAKLLTGVFVGGVCLALLSPFVIGELLAIGLLAGYGITEFVEPKISQKIYDNDLKKVNDLITEREKRPKYIYTLSSVFPSEEIQEKALETLRNREKIEVVKTKPLILKRELTKKDEEI